MQKGQTVILFLVFMVVAIIVISGAVAVSILNSQSTSKFSLSQEALYVAEAGAEDALMRLVRNPNFDPGLSGYSLSVGSSGDSTITVNTNGNIRTITSIGESVGIKRKVEVIGQFTNGVFSITGYQELN